MNEVIKIPKPIVLIILDGWGVAPPGAGNAITEADTPNFDKMVNSYPAMVLKASGEVVGLGEGEAGNSEAGHATIGSGRIFYKDLVRISKTIREGVLLKNKKLLGAFKHAAKHNSDLHLVGLLSDGGKESHKEHLYALLDMARSVGWQGKIFIHALLDGRDVAFNSGEDFIKELLQKMPPEAKITSLCGRSYALDRDGHWEKTEKAYRAISEGKSEKNFNDAISAIENFYENKIYDEDIPPIVFTDAQGTPLGKIKDNDAVIFFNFGISRLEQLIKAFADKRFNSFKKQPLKNLHLVSFWSRDRGLALSLPFPREVARHYLAKELNEAGLKQLHVAESEKYAHATYYFDAFNEEKVKGEEWELIPSKGSTCIEEPAMSAREIKDRVIRAINKGEEDFIVLNFANADMLGHYGDLEAAKKGIEVLDKCIGEIKETVLSKDGVLFIVGSHGNAEEILHSGTGQTKKTHTANPVPFLIVGDAYEGRTGGVEVPGGDLSLVKPVGSLIDVAPTILKVMNLKKPKEMKGKSLLNK
ncbi:MAG: 2,3-bisphosphoglycerate-independent phosphoglycerate mutase [Patescibacteria group bacterium]|nr:2,3-bisphosphoglycerate-independent phosphoglycerate mutase [Patescibacteria group bacterium]MDD5490351.1 2,3-bisphosphoglycerate-independent phosphoglycerate mutase [Patescibacteria group bacterium]